MTPVKGKSNKSLTKQNTVRHGQNTTNKHFNFSKQSDYKLLKLTTMKKQILILFVSLFFGFMGAYGQMVQNSAPRPLSCTTGPLNPVAGVPYDYSALVDPAGGNAYWFATYNNTTFMSGSALTANQELIGGDFVSAATNYRDAATVAPATTTTNITWNSLGLATVTCLTSDELHPVPGTDYDYTVNVPTPPGTKYYNWFVTQDQNFITGSTLTTAIEANDGTGAHIQATGAGYNDPGTIPTPGTGTNTINITWKSFTHDPAAPVFLVIYVQNDDACTTDNIQVYVIEPAHAFTLDIANIGIDGSAQGDNFEMCVSDVVSAVYNLGTSTVDMDLVSITCFLL
jgi:hypothetical protein